MCLSPKTSINFRSLRVVVYSDSKTPTGYQDPQKPKRGELLFSEKSMVTLIWGKKI